MMDSVDPYPSKPPIDITIDILFYYIPEVDIPWFGQWLIYITIDILFYYIPEVDIPGLGLDNGQSISCMIFL